MKSLSCTDALINNGQYHMCGTEEMCETVRSLLPVDCVF